MILLSSLESVSPVSSSFCHSGDSQHTHTTVIGLPPLPPSSYLFDGEASSMHLQKRSSQPCFRSDFSIKVKTD